MKGPQTGKLNIVKMSILLKLIYRLNVIPIKIPARYLFYKHRQLYSKIYMERHCTGPRVAKIILAKKKMEIIILPNIKAYYIGTVIKTICYQCINTIKQRTQKQTQICPTDFS